MQRLLPLIFLLITTSTCQTALAQVSASENICSHCDDFAKYLDVNQKPISIYIDAEVKNRSFIETATKQFNSKNAFQLFSPGKSGQLLLDGEWKNAKQIATWLQESHALEQHAQLNIYGCEFGKGKKGKAALSYLAQTLAVCVAASDDLTGIDGDWELEVGDTDSGLRIAAYNYNLQCTNPTTTAYALPPSCTNGSPNNDGYLQISTAADATHHNFIIGSDYSTGDTDITNAIAFDPTTDLPLQLGTLTNPTGLQDYTIRVFNGASSCFTDVTVTLLEQNCTTGCDCTEFIYLNEVTPSSGGVHKFDVMTDGTLTEIGSPWFSNNAVGEELTAPHGLGVDLNGFLYVGETASGDIRRFTCDGTILPEIEFVINDGAYNFVSYKNRLFINKDAAGIQEYNLCTGALTTTHLLDGLINAQNWGLTINGSTIYATANFTNNSTSLVWRFDAATNDPSVPVPALLQEGTQTVGTLAIGDNFLPRTAIQGIDVDDVGNMYIIQKNIGTEIAGMPANSSRVLKYSPTGILLDVSDWDNALGSTYPGETDPNNRGFANATGLVYSETSSLLYIASISPVEDCVALMDTNLNYLGAAVPFAGSGQAKGIAITDECCPSPTRQTINEVLCGASIGDKLFLNEVFPCKGIVCGAAWTPDTGNMGMTYDDCDQSITITNTVACASFTKKGTNDQCGAYDLTFNVEVLDVTAPVIAGISPTCANSNDPASFTITTPASSSSTITYRWQSSTTDCSTGFADIAGAPTDATPYDPTTLSQETYYRVITEVSGNCSSGICADTSNCVTLTPEAGCTPVCTNPTVTAFALPPSCTNDTPNNDGYLQITEVINGDRYHFSIGSTFDDFIGSLPLTYANATSFGTFPEETTADLSNPTGSQDYTIRVYNGASACFTDVTITLLEEICTPDCPAIICIPINVTKNND